MNKYIVTLLAIVSVCIITGCSQLKSELDPTGKKSTTMYMTTGVEKCAEHFVEMDATHVYSGAGIVTDLVTTCISVTEDNVSCPEHNILCIKKNIIK